MFSVFRLLKIMIGVFNYVSYCDILWLNTVLQTLSRHKFDHDCIKIDYMELAVVTHTYTTYSFANYCLPYSFDLPQNILLHKTLIFGPMW